MYHSVIPPEKIPQLMIAGIGFTGVLLAYMYFVMGWATNRMKDWEALKEEPKSGQPALVCWIAGVGDLMAGLIGVHIFSALYFILCGGINWWSRLILSQMVFIIIWMWSILLVFLYFYYYKKKGKIDPLRENELSSIISWHPPLTWTMIPFILAGCSGVLECYRGNIYAGLSIEMFELCGSFSLGAYCALRGDLLVRACVKAEAQQAEAQQAEAQQAEAQQAEAQQAEAQQAEAQQAEAQQAEAQQAEAQQAEAQQAEPQNSDARQQVILNAA